MSTVYKPNWDLVKDIKVELERGYYVPYGRDRNGKYGELMPDGLVFGSHFYRVDEHEGIPKLDYPGSRRSIKFGDCYYIFNDRYYKYTENNRLPTGPYYFHRGNEPYGEIDTVNNPTILDIEDEIMKQNKLSVKYLSILNSISNDSISKDKNNVLKDKNNESN